MQDETLGHCVICPSACAVTQIVMVEDVYPAEPEQQNRHQNNPVHNAYYRGGCGRGARLKQLCGENAGQ